MVVLQQRCVWGSVPAATHCDSAAAALFVLLSGKRSLIPTSCFPPHTDQLHTHTHADTHVVGGGSRHTRTHTHRPVVGGGKEPHTHTLEGTPSAVGSNTAWTYFLIFLTLLLRSPDFEAVFFVGMRHWGVRRRLGARKRAWLYFNRDSSVGRRNRKHGLQKVALKAWNISWCRQRRYRPYSSSRRRRRMLSGDSAGV